MTWGFRLTWPPDLPRPHCLPSMKPQSWSTLMGRSSSVVPFRYFTQLSASLLLTQEQQIRNELQRCSTCSCSCYSSATYKQYNSS